MKIELTLVQHGMGMQDATVTQWLKKEGDPVAKGEIILEVESAKTLVEIEAPVNGVLSRIVAPQDATVEVGELLAEIESAEGESAQSAAPESASSAATSEAATSAAPAEPASGSESGAAGSAAAASKTASSNVNVQVEPRARKTAQEKGVDLASVRGTGPNGRITEADVLRHADATTTADAAFESRPIAGVRATIARRMSESLQKTAQLTLTSSVDVTALVEQREAAKSRIAASYTELIVKAVALALRQRPDLNATRTESEIRLHQDINVGVAVQTDAGLMVPVLKQADQMPLEAIVERLRALIARVREGSASNEELTGGTFTVTNLGNYGIDAFTPILHSPQVAILGVGRITDVPTRASDDSVVWKKNITLSLTFDHCVLDGAPAAEFLQVLAALLAEPKQLFD